MVAGVASLAGGGPGRAVVVGASMTALQFAIGALNDLVDAPADAGRKPAKPIPGGEVAPATARVVAVVMALIGVGLAATVNLILAAVALVVLSIGAAYDLVFKGTAWSWLPFAVGIPILPVYGWFGATGSLPEGFAVLIPAAALAGAGLAIANARADADADRASGTASVATRLGTDLSWWVGAGLMGAAAAAAFLPLAKAGWAASTWVVVLAGLILVVAGLLLGRGDGISRRRAWEVQAIGAAVAATGWVSGISSGA